MDLAFLNRDFQKRIKEMIYRFCLNALEIHNLLKIAPNLLKQYLLLTYMLLSEDVTYASNVFENLY